MSGDHNQNDHDDTDVVESKSKIYADAETRECWRINYGILRLDSARDANDFWERRGGVFPGCVLALAHAIEQIDADELLMRQALEALDCIDSPMAVKEINQVGAAKAALQKRLCDTTGADHA